MVGNTSTSSEQLFGRILAPYLKDPANAFVISSDFAHWGLRFHYTYYEAPGKKPIDLRQTDKQPRDPPIHDSIKQVDFQCMGACEFGSHDEWLQVLSQTRNTVCGRHPIGVVMAGIEEIEKEDPKQRRFRFVRYERSSEVKKVTESSVSYASAFCVI